MKKVILIIVTLFIIFNCTNASIEIVSPDPQNLEGSIDIPDNIYLAVNIDGQIIGFNAENPSGYGILADNAATDEKYSNIKLSDNNYLLYSYDTGSQIDLVLKNLNTDTIETIANNIESNESEFIDANTLQYSYGGNIYVYNIATQISHLIIPHQDNRCNHWAQFSPDSQRVIFKDQDPTKDDIATHAWSELTDLETMADNYNAIISYEGIDNPVDLYDNFYYSWRDNNHVIFKRTPGLTNIIREKNLEIVTAQPTYANLINSKGYDILFDKLKISPDGTKLLIYGYKGVYLLDLTTTEYITGTIEPLELFSSTILTTIGTFSADSQYILIANENWAGIYDCESLAKTFFKLDDLLDSGLKIYSVAVQGN